MSDECMIREYEKREKNGEMRGVIRKASTLILKD